jgi:regulatory protein SWI4
MRRLSDDWVNATQILKAAKFPKAHRTRILEREVQTGIHKIIQGGYGRFQGTWIPLEIARPLAHKYNITDAMAPILSYVPDPNNPVERKSKGKTAVVATEEGSPSKKPKKVYNTKKRRAAAAAAAQGSNDYIPQSQPPPQHNQYDQHSLPNGMLPPVSVAPDVKFWQQNGPPSFQQMNGYQQTPAMAQFPNHHQQPMMGLQYTPQLQQHSQQVNFQRQAPIQQQQMFQHPPTFAQPMQQQHPQQHQIYQQHKAKNSNENWSQDDGSNTQMDEVMRDSDTSISSEDEHGDSKHGKAYYTDALIQFFANDTQSIPQSLLNPPSDFDFNEPIDEEGHTPLHWAASMASTPLVELLLSHGADPLAPNATGLNCVSRAIFFNNSFQKRNFHLITGMMKNCLYTPDKSGRTPLHYLFESTRSKAETAQYYLETILQQLSQGNKDLLKIVVNHPDVHGDTAIQLASKAGNSSMCEILKPYSRGDEHGEDADENRTDPYEQQDATPTQEPARLPSLPKMPMAEVGPMLTSMLSSLADAYDTELKSKEEESHHTKTVLDKLKQDLESTESKNTVVLAQIESGLSLEQLLDTIDTLDDKCATKSQNLGKIIERSQALTLAQKVLKEESSIVPSGIQDDPIRLAMELTRLQMNRAKTVGQILDSLTVQNINEKMNRYRRLIAMACTLKTENVDDLIDEIEADLLTTAV